MNDEQIYKGLEAVFHDVFDDESIVLKPETSAADIDGWDSFNHVNIIVSAEQTFGVSFSTSEIETLKNVGDLVAVIRAKNPQRAQR
jgi:acyl carrier protein